MTTDEEEPLMNADAVPSLVEGWTPIRRVAAVPHRRFACHAERSQAESKHLASDVIHVMA